MTFILMVIIVVQIFTHAFDISIILNDILAVLLNLTFCPVPFFIEQGLFLGQLHYLVIQLGFIQ